MIPKVDVKSCIECNLCEKVCPALNNHPSLNNYTQSLYAAYAKDNIIRNISSSGGLFYILSKYIIANNGKVYAVSFDNLICKHTAINYETEIIKCVGSKYIQSNIQNIYNKIKVDLKLGQLILFIGTPCQCKALLNIYNNNKPNNLYIIDFICHGVCSQELFNKAINYFEKAQECNVIDFSFRHKTEDSLRKCKIEYIDTKNNIISEIIPPYEFPYYNAFLNHYIFRYSCYKCSYKRIKRVSDITLGDFWNIENIDTNIKDPYLGYSAIIINSEKGSYLFESIKKYCFYKEFPIRSIINNNYALTKKDEIPVIRYLYKISYLKFPAFYDLLLTNKPSLFSRIIRGICYKLDKMKNKL